jgi:hypothetical protein
VIGVIGQRERQCVEDCVREWFGTLVNWHRIQIEISLENDRGVVRVRTEVHHGDHSGRGAPLLSDHRLDIPRGDVRDDGPEAGRKVRAYVERVVEFCKLYPPPAGEPIPWDVTPKARE